jgi:DNA-binding MarR family transcriptional regulator
MPACALIAIRGTAVSENDSFARLARVIAAVNHRLDQDVASGLVEEGLPLEQMRVLEALTEADGQPMQRLAESVLSNPTTLTKIIDRMIAQALVYRAQDPEDRRRVLIFLSDHGRAVELRLRAAAARRTTRLAEALKPEDADRLADKLRALI